MAAKKKPEATEVTAYKAFNADLTCNGYPFKVGETFEHPGAVVMCRSGFHACENPFDCLSYYDLIDSSGNLARFARATLSGSIDRHRDDSKVVGGKIVIEAELGLPGFVKAAVDWLIAATKGSKDLSDNGGYSARIGSSGNYAQIGSSGDSARIGSSGYSARIGSSGNYARIDAKGENSIIASAGPRTTASGAIGTWISLAEFDRDGKCVGFASGIVGMKLPEGHPMKGRCCENLKPDTPYKAQGGKLVSA